MRARAARAGMRGRAARPVGEERRVGRERERLGQVFLFLPSLSCETPGMAPRRGLGRALGATGAGGACPQAPAWRRRGGRGAAAARAGEAPPESKERDGRRGGQVSDSPSLSLSLPPPHPLFSRGTHAPTRRVDRGARAVACIVVGVGDEGGFLWWEREESKELCGGGSGARPACSLFFFFSGSAHAVTPQNPARDERAHPPPGGRPDPGSLCALWRGKRASGLRGRALGCSLSLSPGI